jgi:hypothetical protein
VLLMLAAAPAHADDNLEFTEFWPEINVYRGIDERSRLLLTAAATKAAEGLVQSIGSSIQDAQFGANFDYTLAPVLRSDVPRDEWSKNRLLWARLGFNYGTSASSGSSAFRSYTALAELTTRYPLGDALWLHNRLRVDFRRVNGEPSQRYRVRLGAEGATVVLGRPVAPYGDVEVLYDTRHGKWSRTVLKAGVETPLAAEWRIEPYLALQLNRPGDEVSRVLALGLTLKYYWR